MANRPPLTIAKNLVLKFARNLLAPQFLKAIEIILSPCCAVTVTSAEAVCVEAGTYDITLTLSEPLNLLQRGVAFLIKVSNVSTQSFYYVPDGTNQLIFKNVDLSTLIPGVYTLTGEVLFVTQTGSNSSIDQLGKSIVVVPLVTDITLPSCI